MRFELRSGVSLPTSGEVLTFNGVNHIYKNVQDIDIGDIVCVKRDFMFNEVDPEIFYEYEKRKHATNTKDAVIPKYYSPDLGEWLGYVIANGSASCNFVSMSSIPSLKTENYVNLVKRLFNLVVKSRNDSRSCKNFCIHSVKVKELLDYLCDGFCTARYKTVPSGIFESTRETQRKFLRALFDCDGSQTKRDFEYSSASEHLIRGVQQILLRFGIVSFLKRRYVKEYPDHTYWKLHITGFNLDTLYDQILYDSFKYPMIERKARNTNVDVIYGVLEKIIYDVNTARKTLGVAKSGTYRLDSGELVRFKAARQLVKINSTNISYDALMKVYDDLVSAPEDQVKVLSELISYIYEILESNYFYDVVDKMFKDPLDCEFNEVLLIKESK